MASFLHNTKIGVPIIDSIPNCHTKNALKRGKNQEMWLRCYIEDSFVTIPSKKSSAQVGVRVNSVLTRNDCIKCYISLFKEITLQQFDAFQTEIQGSLTKLCAFRVSRGHSSKVVKLPIMSPGAEDMEYLNIP